MPQIPSQDVYGVESPGGFVFGMQGFNWGEQKVTSITFFIDNTVKVCDQYGRPIKGIELAPNKQVLFARQPPSPDDKPDARKGLCTHKEAIAALSHERIDWQKLTWAGWPQLGYDDLKKLPVLPPTPSSELRKIKDPELRRDALRLKREVQEAALAEMEGLEEDEYEDED